MDEYKTQIQARSIDETVQEEKEDEGYGWCAWMLIIGSVMLILATFPISIWFCLKTVQEYERAVIFRLGKLLRGGAKGPGLIWFIPYTDSFSLVDLRTVSFSVPPQEVLSKDSVTVMVDAIVYYRIFDPVRSVVKVKNVASVTHLLAQTTLRNILGTRNLSDIISDRMNMAQQMEGLLFEASQVWGVKVERVEFKDVRLPSGLQRMMAAEAEAVREAKAKVIAAEGELNASHALRDAAAVMKRHPTALQLRYLQTLTEVASEHNSTIFFPVPINLMSGFVRK
ncbi:erythrocyte band 7 integral membrane protein-like [Amblyraja radiata]|uniref:erythrocyte band 7 integral membrane protein-like n=1 Tax=Amblyraja radiata TaxID=386614 RepID=UPI0014038C10|nr:erythrocyte band 7 integral membrane protein-like [Amblyraja radiata]